MKKLPSRNSFISSGAAMTRTAVTPATLELAELGQRSEHGAVEVVADAAHHDLADERVELLD